MNDPTSTTPATSSRPTPIRVAVAPAGRAPGDPTLVVHANAGARIEWLDPEHAILAEEPPAGVPGEPIRTRLWLGPVRRRAADGRAIREVVVDGWRVEVELESDDRATLRDRARRDVRASGPNRIVEIRAELPGRIAALSVTPGELVVGGQLLLAIEAMKMLNELRAPRAGTVERIAVAVGDAIELGDLLVALR